MCFDFIDGPAHMFINRTSLHITNADDVELTKIGGYELVPCPNRFSVKGSLTDECRKRPHYY